MSSKANTFLDQYLGKDFMESLVKTELWKPGTKSVTDIDDMRIGLKIVPRTVMALLVRELTPMNIGETKEISLEGLHEKSLLRVTKHERDVYSGEIEEGNKKLTEFKFRSIPGVGLVVMSAFELYHFDEVEKDNYVETENHNELQRMIDERLSLHSLVGKVIDNKLMERDAVHELVLAKLTEAIQKVNIKVNAAIESSHIAHQTATEANIRAKIATAKARKQRPLEEFLEKRKQPKEFAFQLAKGESVSCPDCGKGIFDGNVFSACVCYGDSGKVFLKKTEDGFKIRFSKNWDIDNIEMLLELLRERNK